MSEEKTFSMGEVSTLVNALVGALRSEMSENGGVLIKTSTSKKGEVNIEVRAHMGAGRSLADTSADAQKVFDELCVKYNIEVPLAPGARAEMDSAVMDLTSEGVLANPVA